MMVVVFVGCSVQSTHDKKLLTEAAKLHNEAIALAEQLEKELKLLASDTTIAQDSVVLLHSAIKAWEDDLVEVPGNEAHHHPEGAHHHRHAEQPDLTPEQMLTVQQELFARIQNLQQRLENLK